MGRFGNIDLMQLVLVAILLLCGYFFLFQAVAKRAASRSAIPMLAVVLLLVYLLISLPLVLIISQMGGLSFTFLALLILAAFIGLVAFLSFLFKNFRHINKGMLLLFLLYLLMTGYFTIFSRRGQRGLPHKAGIQHRDPGEGEGQRLHRLWTVRGDLPAASQQALVRAPARDAAHHADRDDAADPAHRSVRFGGPGRQHPGRLPRTVPVQAVPAHGPGTRRAIGRRHFFGRWAALR